MKFVKRAGWAVIFASVIFVNIAEAEEDFLEIPAVTSQESAGEMREPAAAAPIVSANKRTYPGGLDEEDLQVQNHLPEASLRTDARYLQREVYKNLYNQELKDERQDAVEE